MCAFLKKNISQCADLIRNVLAMILVFCIIFHIFIIQSVVAVVAGQIAVQNILNIIFSSDYLNQPSATRKHKYFTKVKFCTYLYSVIIKHMI